MQPSFYLLPFPNSHCMGLWTLYEFYNTIKNNKPNISNSVWLRFQSIIKYKEQSSSIYLHIIRAFFLLAIILAAITQCDCCQDVLQCEKMLVSVLLLENCSSSLRFRYFPYTSVKGKISLPIFMKFYIESKYEIKTRTSHLK